MDTQVADTLLGSLVDGRYRIRARVARGGMATVYTAVDERLERIVALKIIHPSQAGDARFLTRFTDEAKTIARLTHPNVVAVYDQGSHNGLPYLVMEYVRGRTLRELLVERRRLNPAEALAILEQMLAAIAASHRAGLVHRDVKPENVLVAEAPTGGSGNLVDSVVKVADFGLARAVEVSADDDGDGHLMATVAYVAPELVTEGQADARTDVYSAGIVLFEMLTGRVPYDGDKPVEVAWQHVDHDVPAPSKVVPGSPKVLDDLVARATRRDPAGRPTDAGALLAEVQAVRDDLGVANADTALLRQVGQPTAVVPTVQPTQRPAWARLPEQKDQPSPRRRRPPADNLAAPTAHHVVARQPAAAPADDQRRRIVLVAALVAVGLVLVGGGWWATIGRYTAAPQLVNMTRSQAEAAATRDGFRLAFAAGRYDEQVDRDVVLSQDPPLNGRVVKGGTVTVVLSLGPERYPVPDVVGKETELARSELEGLKLVWKKGPDRFDDSLPKGVVVAVEPKVGDQVKPGDTVTVTVSKGKAPIAVPNLVGKNINEVRGLLQQRGLTAVEVYKDSDKPKDEVIAQDPANGTGVEKGAKINLEVSKGPALVTVPRVKDLPCQQAKAALEALRLRVRVDFNPNGTVRFQNPDENSQAAPQSEVVIGCF
ncbi:MAG TPA: Stk1 family PASTA domain-containing Ser/Thr kinase [Catenuloplanes sp.]